MNLLNGDDCSSVTPHGKEIYPNCLLLTRAAGAAVYDYLGLS